jgi:hypothetical protein
MGRLKTQTCLAALRVFLNSVLTTSCGGSSWGDKDESEEDDADRTDRTVTALWDGYCTATFNEH